MLTADSLSVPILIAAVAVMLRDSVGSVVDNYYALLNSNFLADAADKIVSFVVALLPIPLHFLGPVHFGPEVESNAPIDSVVVVVRADDSVASVVGSYFDLLHPSFLADEKNDSFD